MGKVLKASDDKLKKYTGKVVYVKETLTITIHSIREIHLSKANSLFKQPAQSNAAVERRSKK